MKNPNHGAAALAITMLAAGAATAQNSPNAATVGDIVVTGSRIHTSPLAQEQPVIQISREDALKTGLSSTADILQRLPSAAGGLNSKFNNSGNFGNPPDGGGVGAGSAEIDLRYLSSRRVLVLVDGLRWVSGASASGVPGAVDLNTIPASMISRIEVLQEGASPIYGSDAIAGVVNIITKTRQHGLEVSGQYGVYGQGDGASRELNASWGAQENKTTIVIGGGYIKQDPVSSGKRSISLFPNPGETSCLGGGCSSGTPLGRFIVHDLNTGQALDLTLKQALAPGVRPSYDPLNPTGPGSSFKDFTTADRFNFQPYNYIISPSERFSLFGQVTQEITDNIKLRVRGSYVDRRSANQAAPLPLFVGPDAGNGNLLDTVSIDATNPYNPFGFTLQPGTYSFIGRRLIENGPRHYAQDVNTWNITGTLEGHFDVMGRSFSWDANAVVSRNHAEQSFTGNVNSQRVQQALGPVALCTGGCVPLNLFGGQGTITPDQLKFIAFTQHDISEQTLHDYSANITGSLFDLPAGPLGVAAGYEHRETSGFFEPDPLVVEGLSADIPAQPAKGSIKVDEVYGEVSVPLLKDLPLIHRLDASAAVRWFNYSTSGSDSTAKAGFGWRPFEDVLIRASWAQGYRAPSIGELFGTASRFDQTANDPCSNLSAQPANVQANCIAHGVPANGSYTQLNPQLPVITSGNLLLKPETSKSWTYGFVWEPSQLRGQKWVDGASLELIYADIKLDKAIQAQDAQTLLDRCAQTGDALSCATITRTVSGTISAISNPLINIGGVKTRAIDLNLVYRTPATSLGRVTLHSNTSFLLEYSELVPTSAGLTTIKREGTERGSPDQAYPRTKSTLSLDWDRAAWGATATARYLSAVTETNANNNKLGATAYLDAQLRYSPEYLKGFQVAVGVNNLLDKDPPGCISCGLNNFDPNAYDAPGRFFYFRLSYRQ